MIIRMIGYWLYGLGYLIGWLLVALLVVAVLVLRGTYAVCNWIGYQFGQIVRRIACR